MKILYIHTYYIQRGGEDMVFENEMKLMINAGYDVRSVIFYNKGLTAVKFLVSLFNPFSFIKVWRAIRRFRPDVVHVHNWFFGASPSVFIAARWMKVPVVHTIHNFRILCPSSFLFFKNEVFMDCVSKVFPYEAIRRKVYHDSAFSTFWLLAGTRLHYFLRTWQKIDRLICLTDVSKRVLCNSFLRLSEDRIVVKPNFFSGSDPVDGMAGPGGMSVREGRSGDFLFVGRLAPEKGIDIMLEAFEKGPGSLRIIGEGPLREKVERSAKENTNIRYLGHQQKEKIIDEMRACSALVFTTVGYEQFGMVIIEAFYCGTPVIGPDTGSPAELISQGVNGIHFRSGSSNDLREKIEYWQSISPEVRHSYVENAADTYRKYFTPHTNLNQLSKIYKHLLQ